MPQAGGHGSTRWCPTPEQLMALEEMYRGGLRTPNAAQIQHITAHLSCYGRIEGKNVFYWFQNHKARDRQKLRRRLCMTHHLLSAAACTAQYYAAAAAAAGHHHGHLQLPHGGGQYYCGVEQSTAAAQPCSYYPLAAAAATAHKTASTSLFQYGQGVGGVMPPEASGRPDYYPLGKLQDLSFGADYDSATSPASAAAPTLGYEMMAPAMDEVATASTSAMTVPPPCCRPLRTLDLFPTSSTTGGLLKDA